MDIRPGFQIQVMIRAMEDVVVPSVPGNQKIAQEQAGLVLATLRTLQKRLSLWYRYDRDELDRFVTLASEILESLDPGAARDALTKAHDTGSSVLQRAKADPEELPQATFALRSAVSGMLLDLQDGGQKIHQSAAGKLVLRAAKTQVGRERAWLLTHGFESDPAAIEPIEKQLTK